MLTDFPYWQIRAELLLSWPSCEMCNGSTFSGDSTWIWTYCNGGGYTSWIDATNNNDYTMRVYWKKFSSPVSGPTASGEVGPDADGYYRTEIASGATKRFTCTSPAGGYYETVGKISVVTPAGEIFLGDIEGQYDHT